MIEENIQERLHFLECFYEVSNAFIEDIFYRRKMGGQESQALRAIFELKMNGKGFTAVNGQWEKLEG